MKAQVMKLAHSIAKTLTGKYATRLSVALKQAWAQVKGGAGKKLSEITPAFMKEFLAMPYPNRVETAKRFGIVAKFIDLINAKTESMSFVSEKQEAFFKKLYATKLDSTCIRYVNTYAFALECGKSYEEALASAKTAFSELYKTIDTKNVSITINKLK